MHNIEALSITTALFVVLVAAISLIVVGFIGGRTGSHTWEDQVILIWNDIYFFKY